MEAHNLALLPLQKKKKKNLKFVPSTCPKLLKLNQDQPSKKATFLLT